MGVRLKAFAATVMIVVVVPWIVYSLPAAPRTYVALSIVAAALVAFGITLLIVIIPAVGSNDGVRTEFLSARAAYLCVIAGLVLFGIVGMGAVIARVAVTLGRR